jgi:hypothetical protein
MNPLDFPSWCWLLLAAVYLLGAAVLSIVIGCWRSDKERKQRW